MKILARTPARISLFGGGTDLESYSSKHGGLVISLAINLYQHLTLNTENDTWAGHTRLPGDISPDLAYGIMTHYGIGSMHHATIQTSFDGVIGAGLGSSGAFSVGLVAAIKRLKNVVPDMQLIAEEAWGQERTFWATGRQDHYAAAYGGMNLFQFGKKTERFPFKRETAEALQQYLHLFYTGGTRASGKTQTERLTRKKIESLSRIKQIAEVAEDAIIERDMEQVGEYLDATWQEKKLLGTSNEKIDGIYDYARKHGASGGKLLGAGGSGYMVFFVHPEKQERFTKAMTKRDLTETDFSIDYNGVQTRIL